MADYTPRSLGDDIADLRDLCTQVQENLHAGYRQDPVFNPFADPPREIYAAAVFHLVSELLIWLAAAVALVALAFSIEVALVAAVVAALLLVCRTLVMWKKLAPGNHWMRECQVRPAVVAQAYPGGFLPPDEDPDTPSFTGVVVFSFDDSVGGEELAGLARKCSEIKHGGPTHALAELKEMLLTGDTEFVRSSFRWPENIAGNAQTCAAPILWVRELDLVDGYLSTDVQLIFVHPELPEHPVPVPPEFWKSSRSLALLALGEDDA